MHQGEWKTQNLVWTGNFKWFQYTFTISQHTLIVSQGLLLFELFVFIIIIVV